MKKLKLSLLAVLSSMAMVGCGSGTSEPVEVHYLTDYNGAGISGIPYECGLYDTIHVGVTDDTGAYVFNPYDYECTFDLAYLEFQEDLFIFDDVGPVNGLYYECYPSGIWGYTGEVGPDGYFDYDYGDTCLISDF